MTTMVAMPAKLESEYVSLNTADRYSDGEKTDQYQDEMGESTRLETMPEIACYPHAVALPHPAMIGLNMAPGPAFISGYRDCAEEALRFLIEVEHLSHDDPLVVGLKRHLQEQQNCFNFGQIYFQDSLEGNQTDLNDSGISLQSEISSYTTQPVFTDSIDSRTHSLSDCSNHELTAMQRQSDGETLTANQILDLASLHQNNPTISGLAEEILSLLEESEEELSDIENEHNEEVIEQ